MDGSVDSAEMMRYQNLVAALLAIALPVGVSNEESCCNELIASLYLPSSAL
jgi:hypothetical protein